MRIQKEPRPQSAAPLMQTLTDVLNNQTAKTTTNMEKNILSSFYHPKKIDNAIIRGTKQLSWFNRK